MKRITTIVAIIFMIICSLSSQIQYETHIIDFISDDIFCGYNSLDISDLDNDGDVDIVCASHNDALLIWFENLGDYSYTKHLIDSDVFGATDVHFVDIDEDLDLDIMLANGQRDQIIWYKNNGNLSFEKTIISNSATGVLGLYPIDFDKDNDIDIVSVNSNSNELVWYENNGDQVFLEHVISDTMTNVFSVCSADLDGDGDIDLVAVCGLSVVWFERLNDDSFISHELKDEGPVYSNCIVDFDFDGDLDIWNGLMNFKNLGEQQFEPHTISNEPAKSVFPTDMDGDGDLDVIYVYDFPWTEGYMSGIEFEDQIPLQFYLIDTLPTYHVYPIDINGDGFKDIYAGGQGGLRFYASKPNGDDYVEISDTAFLNALIHDGVDTNGDSLISYGEAEAVTSLVVGNWRNPWEIADMSGIEAFVNLNTLLCYANDLTSLDLSNNKSLRILRCEENQLSHLELSENTELAILICNSNNLEYLSLTNNTDLQILRANGNSLTNLDLSTNKRLGGKIDDDVLPYFVDNLWGGDCSTINLGDMPNLTEICIWEGFSLDSMEIKLEGSPNAYFTTECVTNSVNIPDTAFLHALIEEGVDTNGDSLISYGEAEVVITLDVNGRVFCENDSCWSIGTITSLAGIESFVNLETLGCSSNQLTSLDVSNNTKLTELYCSFNQLTSLDLSNNKSLRFMRCGDNQLSQLELSENTELAVLRCNSNNLEDLSFTNNTDLQMLQANGNSLTNLNLSTNKRLVGEMDDDVSDYHYAMACGFRTSLLDDLNRINLGDMPTLFEVCVWEGFSLDSLVVVDDDEEFELIELFELEGSPNVCFETNCNGVCDENTGKEESLQAGINIYPNPSNNHLNIETDISDLYNIEITSLNGQHLLSRELKGTTHQLNLSSFQKGVYIITIRSNDFVTTRKIIKL